MRLRRSAVVVSGAGGSNGRIDFGIDGIAIGSENVSAADCHVHVLRVEPGAEDVDRDVDVV